MAFQQILDEKMPLHILGHRTQPVMPGPGQYVLIGVTLILPTYAWDSAVLTVKRSNYPQDTTGWFALPTPQTFGADGLGTPIPAAQGYAFCCELTTIKATPTTEAFVRVVAWVSDAINAS